MTKVPILAGPTASGKSAAAMRLAEALDLEIVSADSMQVYVGMDVGTAKPTLDERARVPHHMLDVVTPAEPYSVAQYVRGAEAAIDEVLGRGRLPLVTGGTGFYLRALRDGLPTVPPADPAVQAPLWELVAAGRLAELVAELEALSPADASRAAQNPRRVVRSLEVLRRTGRPPSAFPLLPPRHEYALAVLRPDPPLLATRVAARTGRMFELGLVAEVAALLAAYPQQPTALQAIGYKEVARHLRGELSEAEAQELVTVGTRRYAKRQITFFKGFADASWFGGVGEELGAKLTSWLERLVG